MTPWKYIDVKKLDLFTKKKFLFVIKHSNSDFQSIVNNKALYYKKDKKLKSDGVNYREIYMPDYRLKSLLKKVNVKILSSLSFPSFVHCGPQGRSIVTATRPHKNFLHHVSLDVDSFFDSVSKSVTKKSLVKAGFNVCIVDLIIDASVEDNRLPQGFPTSSLLSALVVSQSLEGFYTKFNKDEIVVSVYADDILLSSNDVDLLNLAEGFIKVNLQKVGLSLNDAKKATGKRGEKFQWLGLQIHPWVTLPREKLKRLQRDVYIYKTTGIIPKSFKPRKPTKSIKASWKKSMKGKVQFSQMIAKNHLQSKIKKMLD